MKKNNIDEFIKKAKNAHPDENLDFSKVDYVNNRTKVCIIDHDLDENGEEYGEFWITPWNLICGRSNVKKKGKKISEKKSLSQDEIIKRFNEVHKGENLDYSCVVYKNMHTKVKIIDPVYGEYYQEPVVHLKGCGHPLRGKERTENAIKHLSKEDVINKSNILHNYKYNYIQIDGTRYRDKIKIVCPKHGIFTQSIENHLAGNGCPKCGRVISNAEIEIENYLKSLVGDENVMAHNRKLLGNGKEIDIYLPKYGIAIEFDGLVWHSEKYGKGRYYHLEKTELCKEKGIRLIHIFEDEWIDKKEIILNKLRHFVNMDAESESIGARKCIVKKIDKDSACSFLDKFHIQGFASSTVYLGAFYGNILLAVMTFKREDRSGLKWELNRFATDTNYRLPGIASKMFKYFRDNYEYEEVKSFLDRRWNDYGDSVYEKLGFVVDKILPPDYYYTDGNDRFHKFGFRKGRLSKKYGLDIHLTEEQMVEKIGYDRIWNCGLVRYVYKKK